MVLTALLAAVSAVRRDERGLLFVGVSILVGLFCTYFVVRIMFGHMSEVEASSSIDLCTSEVMPHLSKLAT